VQSRVRLEDVCFFAVAAEQIVQLFMWTHMVGLAVGMLVDYTVGYRRTFKESNLNHHTPKLSSNK